MRIFPTGVTPKCVKPTLEPMTNTYAVEADGGWAYYPIKLGERRGLFVEIDKLPPVLAEGFITYLKKLYKVSTKDYLRRKFNVARNHVVPSPSSGTDNPSSTVVGRNESTVDGDFEAEISEEANLAWKDQIDSLLHSIDPEEEW